MTVILSVRWFLILTPNETNKKIMVESHFIHVEMYGHNTKCSKEPHCAITNFPNRKWPTTIKQRENAQFNSIFLIIRTQLWWHNREIIVCWCRILRIRDNYIQHSVFFGLCCCYLYIHIIRSWLICWMLDCSVSSFPYSLNPAYLYILQQKHSYTHTHTHTRAH